jgi:hypothetical protein
VPFGLFILLLLLSLVIETSSSHINVTEVQVKPISKSQLQSQSQSLPEYGRELLRKFPETVDWGEVNASQTKVRTDIEHNHVSKNLQNTSIESSDGEDF